MFFGVKTTPCRITPHRTSSFTPIIGTLRVHTRPSSLIPASESANNVGAQKQGDDRGPVYRDVRVMKELPKGCLQPADCERRVRFHAFN